MVAQNLREPVGVSLGCHVEGGAAPHGDLKYVPNTICSVLKRIVADHPKRDKDLFKWFVESTQDWIASNIEPIPLSENLNIDSWLDNSNYDSKRRSQLRKVGASIGVDEEYIISRVERDKRSTEVHFFTKDEVYLNYKHVRQIYARVDEYKCVVAPFFHRVEEDLYKRPEFIKHIPTQQRAKYVLDWVAQGSTEPGERIFVSTDYTAYEGHFDPPLLEGIEGALYRRYASASPRLTKIVEFHQRVTCGINRCVSKRSRVDIRAKRMSGEMCTSLGNGFTNFAVHRFITRVIGLDPFSRCVIEGDDAVYSFVRNRKLCEHGILRPDRGCGDCELKSRLRAKGILIGWVRGVCSPHEATLHGLLQGLYTGLGFNVKIEFKDVLPKAGFCSMFFDSTDLIIVPEPMKKLLSFGWAGGKYYRSSGKKLRELLRGKALSLLAESRGVPILQSCAVAHIRLTHGSHYRIDDFWQRQKMKDSLLTPLPITPQTRNLMHELHGFSVEEQMELERWFDSMTAISAFNHPLLISKLTSDQRHFYEFYVFDTDVGHEPPIPLPMNNYPNILGEVFNAKTKGKEKVPPTSSF